MNKTHRSGSTDIEDFLIAHRGEAVTAVQISNGTGVPLSLVNAVLNVADERGWVNRLPGGKWEPS